MITVSISVLVVVPFIFMLLGACVHEFLEHRAEEKHMADVQKAYSLARKQHAFISYKIAA